MESRAKILGHSAHQLLIVFPLGLLGTSAAFDVAYLFTANANFSTVSFWMIVAGLIGGAIAAPPGTIDWFAIPSGTRAKRVGALHGIGNVVVLALFGASAWLRWPEYTVPSMLAVGLAFGGVALALVTGWLGGELVDRLGVGVYNGAHLDSPSSLSGRPAHEGANTKSLTN